MTTALLPDRIFDSVSGEMISGEVIFIEDDRISAIGPATEVPDPIRLEGMTVVPGLIDVHTHLASPLDNGHGSAWMVQRTGAQDALMGVKHARETLRAGFTTVRDIGPWRAFTDVALRDAIEAGWVEGPRMSCAGAFVTCPGTEAATSPGWPSTSTPASQKS